MESLFIQQMMYLQKKEDPYDLSRVTNQPAMSWSRIFQIILDEIRNWAPELSWMTYWIKDELTLTEKFTFHYCPLFKNRI